MDMTILTKQAGFKELLGPRTMEFLGLANRNISTDKEIAQFMLRRAGAGALVGGGAAAITNLIHMLNSERARKKEEEADRENANDTLVINLPPKAAEVKSDKPIEVKKEVAESKTATISHKNQGRKPFTGKFDFSFKSAANETPLPIETKNPTPKQQVASLIIAAATGALGFAGVDALYNNYRRKKLQKELELRRNEFLTTLTNSDDYKQAEVIINDLFPKTEHLRQLDQPEVIKTAAWPTYNLAWADNPPAWALGLFMGGTGLTAYFTKRIMDLKTKQQEALSQSSLPKVKKIIFKTLPSKQKAEEEQEPKLLAEHTSADIPLDTLEREQVKVAFLFALDRVMDNKLSKDAEFRQVMEKCGLNVDDCVKLASEDATPITKYAVPTQPVPYMNDEEIWRRIGATGGAKGNVRETIKQKHPILGPLGLNFINPDDVIGATARKAWETDRQDASQLMRQPGEELLKKYGPGDKAGLADWVSKIMELEGTSNINRPVAPQLNHQDLWKILSDPNTNPSTKRYLTDSMVGMATRGEDGKSMLDTFGTGFGDRLRAIPKSLASTYLPVHAYWQQHPEEGSQPVAGDAGGSSIVGMATGNRLTVDPRYSSADKKLGPDTTMGRAYGYRFDNDISETPKLDTAIQKALPMQKQNQFSGNITDAFMVKDLIGDEPIAAPLSPEREKEERLKNMLKDIDLVSRDPNAAKFLASKRRKIVDAIAHVLKDNVINKGV